MKTNNKSNHIHQTFKSSFSKPHHQIKISSNHQPQSCDIKPWMIHNQQMNFSNFNIHLNQDDLLTHRSIFTSFGSKDQKNTTNHTHKQDQISANKIKLTLQGQHIQGNKLEHSIRFQQYEGQKAKQLNKTLFNPTDMKRRSFNEKNKIKQKINFIEKNKRDLIIFQQTIINMNRLSEDNENKTIQHDVKIQLKSQNQKLEQASKQLDKFVSMKKNQTDNHSNKSNSNHKKQKNKQTNSDKIIRQTPNILNLSYLDKQEFKSQTHKRKKKFLNLTTSEYQSINSDKKKFYSVEQNVYHHHTNQTISSETSPNPQKKTNQFQKILKYKNKSTNIHNCPSNNCKQLFFQQNTQSKPNSPKQKHYLMSRIHSLRNKVKAKKNYLLKKSQQNIFDSYKLLVKYQMNYINQPIQIVKNRQKSKTISQNNAAIYIRFSQSKSQNSKTHNLSLHSKTCEKLQKRPKTSLIISNILKN